MKLQFIASLTIQFHICFLLHRGQTFGKKRYDIHWTKDRARGRERQIRISRETKTMKNTDMEREGERSRVRDRVQRDLERKREKGRKIWREYRE